MKKLTAGIFATLLTVVAVDGAYAAIASQQYVDDINTALTSSIDDKADKSAVTALEGTVTGHTTEIGQINTALESKVDDTDIADMQIKSNMVKTAGWATNKTDDTKYPSAAAVNTAITDATKDIASNTTVKQIQTDLDAAEANITELQTDKQDKNMGVGHENHIVTTDGTGNITSAATIEATKVTGLANVAKTGAYGDLTGTPSLGALASQSTITSAEITDGTIVEADLNTTINASLDKADSALQQSDIANMQTTTNLTNAAEWDADKSSDTKYPSNAAVNAAITDATSGLATDSKMGDLSSLTTTHKTTLVGAINEVDANADAAQADATQAKSDAATAQEAAEAAQAEAEAKIPLPTGPCSDPTAKCVLVSNGTNSFEWEVIARGTSEAGGAE